VGCVWLIEKIFQEYPGGVQIGVQVEKGTLHVEWIAGSFVWRDFAADLLDHGFRLGSLEGNESANKQKNPLNLKLGLCGAFAMNSMLFTLPGYLGLEKESFLDPIFQVMVVIFATLSYLVGGSYFLKRSWSAIRAGIIHIDLPIILGLTVAYVGSLVGWKMHWESLIYFDFVSIFAFLMLAGRWTQEYALEKNRAQLLKKTPRPMQVLIKKNHEFSNCSVEEIREGQEILVGKGQVAPVNGQLLDDKAQINLEWINGEAEQREMNAGSVVLAGAINTGQAELRIKTLQDWKSSILSQLVKPLDSEKMRNRVIENILKYYLIVVLLLSAVGAIYWYTHGNMEASLQVAISVLVVSCPCALGVALPLANELAVVSLSRLGLFVKEGSLWARLAKVSHVCFDKTGTLTMEHPRLLNQHNLENLNQDERNAMARLVVENLHPLARSLSEFFIPEIRDLQKKEMGSHKVEYITGQGVQWQDDLGNLWKLGKPSIHDIQVKNVEHECELSCNGILRACFQFEDSIRDNARDEISKLRENGLDVWILSGDRKAKVRTMANSLGLDDTRFIAEMSPESKASIVQKLGGDSVLMIGDGGNDSLAFNESSCRGTPVIDSGLMEHKADFYFMGRGLRSIRGLFEIGHVRKRAVAQVFAFAVLYNIIAVGICLQGNMNPLLAAILMPISSIVTLFIVSLNYGLSKRQFIK
jgi:Cu2+-exporting ATPase